MIFYQIEYNILLNIINDKFLLVPLRRRYFQLYNYYTKERFKYQTFQDSNFPPIHIIYVIVDTNETLIKEMN